MSLVIIKIEIKKLDGDYNYLNLILRTWGGGGGVQKICKILQTSMYAFVTAKVDGAQYSYNVKHEYLPVE